MTLRERLDDGRVHLLDGAMGTLLYERGVFVNVCYDELSISQPERIRGVHAEYVAAGAEILETNTFGANPVKLSSFGLEDRTEEINVAAARLAREAAGQKALVLGAIGPLGVRIEPWGPTSRDEAVALFRRQIQGLLEGGVHGLILETFGDLDELKVAFDAVRLETDLPTFAQMTVGDSGETPFGTTAAQIARTLGEWGVDVIGLNCSVGPAIMLDAIEEMAEVHAGPLSAQPNAGVPRTVRDRKMYLASPDYMGQYARRMIEAGVRFVGGCCGTTPEHTRKMRDYVASVQPRHVAAHVAARVSSPEPATERVSPHSTPLEERSRLGRKLIRQEWVSMVESVPPRGWDPTPIVERGRRAYLAGVDAVNVLEGSRSLGRMACIPSALLLQRDVGIETVVHYTCRDRNMLGMISDLLGAAGAGIRNLVLTTGDPSAMGPYRDASAVFDIDSIGLTNVVHRLNQGLDPGGNSIGDPTHFVIGVVARTAPIDVEREVERFAWKVEAGAEFAVTQPAFDPEMVIRHLELIARWRVPTFVGVWPLRSVREAEYLQNEVPGVAVPEHVIQRMREAEDRGPGHAAAEGIEIARETVEALRPHVQGVNVSAPGGDVERALAVLAG